MLHTIAATYGTDPWTVTTWTPWRLGLAYECLDAATATMDRRIAQINAAGGIVVPAINLGLGG